MASTESSQNTATPAKALVKKRVTKPSASHRKQFISEAITPVDASFATSYMCTGEPGLPVRFRWRDTLYKVARVLEKWKSTGDCRHGSGEQYVRKHWYRVEVTDGTQMEIYFDRKPRSRKNKQRWWLANIVEDKKKNNQDVDAT
jgi:hypothetical protein